MSYIFTQKPKTMDALIKIQSELTVRKTKYNKFGDFYYRSAEDIMQAIKPLLVKHKATLVITDEVVERVGRAFVRATAHFSDGKDKISVSAEAEIEEERPKMQKPQLTGSSSTYARKYALGGLFLLDDSEDPDSSKKEKAEKKPVQVDERPWLNDSTEEFNKARVWLIQGGSMDAIEKKYRVPNDVKKNLNAAVEAAQKAGKNE